MQNSLEEDADSQSIVLLFYNQMGEQKHKSENNGHCDSRRKTKEITRQT